MVQERAQGRARDKLLYGRRTRVQVRGKHKTLSMTPWVESFNEDGAVGQWLLPSDQAGHGVDRGHSRVKARG